MKNIITILALILIVSCSQDNESMNNLIESENFLNSNLMNQGVIEIESGLQYLVLESSESGMQPNLDNTITADFHGTLIDGTVFWSSIDLGEPLTIVLSQLIPGCQKAISKMKAGDSWRIFIHPDLAYGEAGTSGIPPNSVITFDIDLISIN
jgi:FKBP-type peptidyl-prolyl cis-trans isomerase